MNKTLRREIEIIVYGQSVKFRILKYLVLALLMFFIHKIYGWKGVQIFLIAGAVLGIVAHLFFRWKTKGWTKPWGRLKPPKVKK